MSEIFGYGMKDENGDTVYCCISSCEWEAVTQRTGADGTVYDLCNQCADVWDFAQANMAEKKIKVEVRGGVAYCDDPRVEIVDYDNIGR